MNLVEKINEDLKLAMKAREKDRLEALRAVKTAFTLARSEKGGGDEIDDNKAIQIITRLVKQRKDSAAIYKEQKRQDLYEKEVFESSVLEEYLPEQMTEEELVKVLTGIIKQVGASSPSDMGKVMGMATKQLAGKADNKLISQKVRELLS